MFRSIIYSSLIHVPKRKSIGSCENLLEKNQWDHFCESEIISIHSTIMGRISLHLSFWRLNLIRPIIYLLDYKFSTKFYWFVDESTSRIVFSSPTLFMLTSLEIWDKSTLIVEVMWPFMERAQSYSFSETC